MRKQLTVSRILNMSNESIIKLGENKKYIDVIFPDGVVKMTATEILIDKMVFKNILVRGNILIYPIKKEYGIVYNYVNGLFTPSTINSMLSNIRIDIVKGIFANPTEVGRDEMYNIDTGIINAINELYIIVSILAYSSIVTFDMNDMYEVYNNKAIRDAVDNVKDKYSAESIAEVYSVIDREMQSKYVDTNIGLAYNTKIAKDKQIQHIIGLRGFVQDLDGKIYKYPVPYGYLEGLKDVVSYLIESKTAAIAIFHSTGSIRTSEWFAREAQVKSQSVRKLIFTDCKTDFSLLEILVKPEGLKDFIGCLYKDSLEDKEYKLIEDSSVVGKKIHIRHTGSCNLPNHDEVCLRCFGLMGVGIPVRTNIGAYCSVNITESKTQKLLGFKHLLNSAKEGKPTLSVIADKYLHYVEKDASVKVRSKSVNIKGGKSLCLVLPSINIRALQGSVTIEEIESIYIKQLSSFEEVIFIYVDKDGNEDEPEAAEVLKLRNPMSFSIDFIKYVISTHAFSVGNNNNIRISLEGWRGFTSVPLMIPGMRAENATGEMDDFKDLVTKGKYGAEPFKPIEINSSLLRIYSNIGHGDHLSLLSTMLYATTIDSNNKFRLGRADKKRICYNFRECFKYASFSAIIAYGYLTSYLSTSVFLSQDRADHPLDVLVTPEILNYT